MSEAEREQRKRDRLALYKAASLLAVPVAIILLAALAAGYAVLRHEIDAEISRRVSERREVDVALCKVATVHQDAIRNAIKSAADPTKLEPGDYGYAYAQAHWDEALRRHNQIVGGNDESLKFFPKITCTRTDPRSPLNPNAPPPPTVPTLPSG